MTPKPTSPAERPGIRVVLITLDNHVSGVIAAARDELRAENPHFVLSMHACTLFARSPEALACAREDIARADILILNMLFMDEHFALIEDVVNARRPHFDALVATMSAGPVVKLTKMGGLDMSAPQKGPLQFLKRLRGSKSGAEGGSSGAGQMAMLRRLPKLLKFVPGTAQDLRAYFLTMQYWLAGSQSNIVNMVRLLVERYASGPRAALRGAGKIAPPDDYPDVGLYHPVLAKGQANPVTQDANALPRRGKARGRVGLLLLRSYVLANDRAHYDAVITALEAEGLDVVPAFASGLDARPAMEAYFLQNGKPSVDIVISLTGFSLVGGPAYNDSKAAEAILARLDVPYIAAHPTEFQSLEQWGASRAGLSPVEQTIMVAIPELDGATGPMVFAGRSSCAGDACAGCERACRFEADAQPARMRPCVERVAMLAARAGRLIQLRKTAMANRKVAIVLFNFPPNAGAAGSAAFLSVFESLHLTLQDMKSAGYQVDPPETVEALKHAVLNGNAGRYNTDANVAALLSVEEHIHAEPYLKDIEAVWGRAPGRHLTDGRSLFMLGAQFGNVFVGLQPSSGAEGDPMRLMFENGLAPTHAFSAFYRYLREDFGADMVLHFGTHGALEFMPGKHVGMSGACWPDRLIGAMPNIYLYAANNPSEGALARRRIGATLVSYLTPPVTRAGLHQDLLALRDGLARLASVDAARMEERESLYAVLEERAQALSLSFTPTPSGAERLSADLYALEQTLIPDGLHVLGQTPDRPQMQEILHAAAAGGAPLKPGDLEALADGAAVGPPALQTLAANLRRNNERAALLTALEGRYIRPGPGGDLLRTPDVLPSGRNIHGFDPFRLPSAFAMQDGARQAKLVVQRYQDDHGGRLPETIALVLWGTDALKTEGAPIAQALALMGARPRLDSYGRACGAELIALQELGRPRIDVVMTLSGIFRDLLPLQTKMLAEAAFLAAAADEPDADNFIAKHARALVQAQGMELETAALRVFSNAEGAYGANVNQLIDASTWQVEDDLAEAFEVRKSFAYGRTGAPQHQRGLLASALATADCAYQNLDSVELGVTTLDQYVDTLGGVSRAIARARGETPPVYISDQTQGPGRVRSLAEQVALETHTRTLNPRWYEALLKHGHEGVRQIEAQVTATMGWSATTGKVPHWVYQKISETYVLDGAMRERLARLNPKASARMAGRLLEAHQRKFWTPDPATLAALQSASADIEDHLEGVSPSAAA
jgi:magnesium chelatase subunit H